MEHKLIHSKKRWVAAAIALIVISLVMNFSFMDSSDDKTTGVVSIEFSDNEQQILSVLEKMGIGEEDREIQKIYDPQGKGEFILRVIVYFFLFSIALAVFLLLYTIIFRLIKRFGNHETSEEVKIIKKKRWAIRILTLLIMGILFQFYLVLFSEPEVHTSKIHIMGQDDEEVIIKAFEKIGRTEIDIYTRRLYTSWKHPLFFLIAFRIFFHLLIGLGAYLGIFWSLLALFNLIGRINKSPQS